MKLYENAWLIHSLPSSAWATNKNIFESHTTMNSFCVLLARSVSRGVFNIKKKKEILFATLVPCGYEELRKLIRSPTSLLLAIRGHCATHYYLAVHRENNPDTLHRRSKDTTK